MRWFAPSIGVVELGTQIPGVPKPTSLAESGSISELQFGERSCLKIDRDEQQRETSDVDSPYMWLHI